MIRIHPDLRGEIQRDREALLPFAEEVAIALVRFTGAAEARVLTHGPEGAAVHCGIDAAGKRELAGEAESFFGIPIVEQIAGVQPLDGPAGNSGEARFALNRTAGLGLYVGHAGNLFPDRMEEPQTSSKRQRDAPVYSERARRKELTAKKTNSNATTIATPINQYATSRVQARNAEFSHANARIAKAAPAVS